MVLAEARKREKLNQHKRRIQEIMDAGKKIFRDKGYSSATMEDIAREAELSPAAIYLYFKNKGELYASLNISILKYLVKRLNEISNNRQLTTIQKIESLKDVYYQVFKFDPDIMINVFHLQASQQLNALSPELLSEINTLVTKAHRIIIKIYENGIKEGVFVDIHPVAMADIFWGVFSGLVLWEESKRKLNPKKDYLRSTLNIAFDILNSYIIIKKKE